MTEPKASLSERLSRLQSLRTTSGTGAIPQAEPLAGDWPQGCQAFPASHAQSRLWFLHQLEPGLTAYHMPRVWRLRGELDHAALAQALTGLLERHPTLRTSFQLQGSEVIQMLHPPAPLELQAEPLGDRDLAQVIQAWQEEGATTPFDLSSGVLLRARLLAIGDQEHVLLLDHHHIASDGWSRSVLSRDLSELYNAHRRGQPPQLKGLKVQYQDYAAWQRQRLRGDRLKELNTFWMEQLTGVEPLELPTDHPRPATPSYRGGRVSFGIEPALLAPFEELCRSEGATLQMGLLALLALLLHRTSRQEDFAIGVPIWGRNHPDLELLIGFFVNTLPIRTRFSAELSYRELLAQVKEASINAYDHQELPFEQMVEALNLERDTSRNPLVQVMLQLIELPPASLGNLDGLDVEEVSANGESSQLDLSFYLRRTSEQGLNGTIIYATDLFCGDRMERLSSHLLTLLASSLQSPDAPAASLRLLPESERELIESWQHGPTIEVPDLCVHQLFEQQVERTPDAIALIFADQQLTYEQLNARSNQLAHHLIDHGVGPEVIVAVCLERSVELIVSLLAILKAGGAYLPLDPTYASNRLRDTLQDSKPSLILTDRKGRECLSSSEGEPQEDLPGFLAVDLSKPAWCERSTGNPSSARQDSQSGRLAYVIYTSGSTGRPKGVMISHRAICNHMLWMLRRFRFNKTDRVLQKTSISFDASAWEFWMPLMAGSRLIIAGPRAHQDPQSLIDAIIEHEVTTLQVVPTVFQALLDTGEIAKCIGLSRVFCGGEPLPAELCRRFFDQSEARLYNLYGPTEATIDVTSWECRPNEEGPIVAIGRPIDNVQVYILNEQFQSTPIGLPGELYLGGVGLARGYLNNPELTAEKFISDPFSSDPTARLYKSGDLASWNSDGTLAFHGRIDQQIKLRGFRIEPGEIETNLLAHPAIAQVAVILRHDDPANPRLIAYWVPQQASTESPSSEQLRSFLAQRLPDYMVPSGFVALEALPLTTNGKLDRKALPAPSFAADLEQRVEPSTDLERQLHAIWAEVLGHGDFGVRDNFFAIGGHSLAAARLVARIEHATGHGLALAALFQKPTIAGLVPLLPTSGSDREPLSVATAIPVAIPISGDWPSGCEAYSASYAQSRLWFLHQLEPGLTTYHMPRVWRLRGELDRAALAQALTGLIERHATLRTSFQLQGSEVIQMLHPPVPLQLQAEPLGDRDLAPVIQAWQEQEASTPFDLTSGRLLRARLLVINDQEHVLLLNHHHIASDGWSLTILSRDLTALYNAHSTGQPSQLQPLPIQYKDYAAWQRQRLSGKRQQELSTFWMEQLTGIEPLELPMDHPRSATPSHQGASFSFQIEPEVLAPFEDLCRTEGATLQMGLVALVGLVLHRISRQENFAIGVPIWGRNHPELEELIGFFVNTLPIRCRMEDGFSFRQLLAQVRDTSLAAYDHQELPFEQMVEALQVERDTSRSPLVQVVLQLLDLPETSHTPLAGLQLEELPARWVGAKFDLSFFFRRCADQGLQGGITYACDLFEADRIERMATHLLTLLRSLLVSPDAGVGTLNLLPDAERLQIERWQRGPTIELPDCAVQDLFERQVERTPDAIALIAAEQHWSYGELNVRADQLAHQLMALGVGPEAIVAVCLERSADLVVALLAILKSGGAYLPLDPAWPPARRDQLLRDAGCSALVDARGPVRLAPQPSDTAGAEGRNPGRRLAYVSYTSGSTGTPKGVAIEHRSIVRLVDPINGFHLERGAVVLQLAPVAFDAATLEIWGPLLNGGTLVMAPSGQLSAAELAALLRARGITTLWLTAGLFHAMVESELQALAGVRQVLAGGDVLSPAHVNRLLAAFPPGHELIDGYGPTENTTFTACHAMAAGRSSTTGEADAIPIGRPIAGTVVHVVDPAGRLCPIGVPGELLIGGAGLARGYLNTPERTAEAFIRDPFSDDPTACLYRSGDLVSWNSDGTLAFHSRLDQQLKLRGFRIEPGEIEVRLLAHPAVAQAVVEPQIDGPANPRLIAYWVPATAAPVRAEELRRFLAHRLPEPMVPAAFVELEALPLTPNGKLDRRALPVPSFAGDVEQRVEPTTDLERQLHGLWAEVLGHGDFGVRDNFFAIGGHSLAAAQLIVRVEQVLGHPLPLATLFHAPEILPMAQLLERADPAAEVGDSCLVPLQPQGEATPLFVIHGYGGDVFCYTEFARALAPQRPVYGLQAKGMDGGERQGSVEEMAEHYAGLIERQWPTGEVHLLGQSAGGWYEWAVAGVLLRRGRSLGLVAILDSGPTVAISRRLRASLLLRRTVRRVPAYGLQLSHSKRPRTFLAFLRERRQKLASHLRWFQPEGFRVPSEPPGSPVGEGKGLDYYDLLHRLYRPTSLPLRVHLFLSRHDPRMKQRLWRALACGGVEVRVLFEEHHHFHEASLAEELADAIAQALEQIEGEQKEEQEVAPHQLLNQP